MAHRLLSCLVALTFILSWTGPLLAAQPPQSASANSTAIAPTKAEVSQALHASPVMFIENTGQWEAGARFQVRGGSSTMWLTEDAIWLTVVEHSADDAARSRVETPDRFDPERANVQSDGTKRKAANIKVSFVGANSHPRIEAFDRLDTVVSYFIGNDPAQWRPDVPVWGGVRYVDLYAGVDLDIATEDGQIVQRLAARPGADLSAVRLRVEGADAVAVDGDILRLSTAAGDADWPLLQAEGSNDKAKVQQMGAQTFEVGSPVTQARVERASRDASSPQFAMPGAAGHAVVRGWFPADSPQWPVDNPSDLLYGTFLGGGTTNPGWSNTEGGGYGIAVDGSGAAYVAGGTPSADFPTTPGAFDPSYNTGDTNAFVVKVNRSGSALLYATFLGGNSWSSSITVDKSGAAYVMGVTESADFPTTPGAFDRSYGGGTCYLLSQSFHCPDAFVAKLNPAGSGLLYSTYLGGNRYESAGGLAVDQAGSAYVTGWTESSDFPTTLGAFDTSYNGGAYLGDAFVVKLNPAGSALAYATFLGGSGDDSGFGIAVDGSGAAYVTGDTSSGDFPTTPGAFDRTHRQNVDAAFVVKLRPSGSSLVYATYLGGSVDGAGCGIVVDGGGAAYVSGNTQSADFPTTPGTFDRSYNGGYEDGFVAKLNPSGSGLVYATFLGGDKDDRGEGIAVDESGAAYVTGWTYSVDFPTTPGAFDSSPNGGDGFVVQVNPTGAALTYATFLGGSKFDWGDGIALDARGAVYVAGETSSLDFPTTPGAFDTTYNSGDSDAFVVKLTMGKTAFSHATYLPVILASPPAGAFE